MSATASARAQASRSESPFRSIVIRTGQWVRRLLADGVERWNAWRLARRDERILRNVPGYMLTDMGIDRVDLRRAMRGELAQKTAVTKAAPSVPASTREARRQNTVADQRVRGSRGIR
jgi:hypothetical protein